MLSPRPAAPETPSWGEFWPENPFRIAIDPNGNLIEKTENGEVWDYVWNAENELIRVCKDLVAPQACDSDGVAVASFKYDPLGRRVEKTAGGATANYTYDREDLLRESSAGVSFEYVHGPGTDEPLSREDGASIKTYYHADGLGSIVKTTDSAGAVAVQRRYDAWGNVESGASESGYAFTSREWDPETKLYYYRARYYDAGIGRFISEDPLGFDAGINYYAYVYGNPVRAVDPSGLLSIRISYDLAHDYGIPIHGRTEIRDAYVSKVEDSCTEQCDGTYKLDFTAEATVLMRTGPGCRGATHRHETKHARKHAATLFTWFTQLLTFEGEYSSLEECKRAWREAMDLLKRTKPQPSSPFEKFKHVFQYIPCVN